MCMVGRGKRRERARETLKLSLESDARIDLMTLET